MGAPIRFVPSSRSTCHEKHHHPGDRDAGRRVVDRRRCVRRGAAAPAEHRVHPVRRPGLRGRRVQQSGRQDHNAAHRPAGRRRDAVHRCPHDVVGLHADAVQRADGALQLAFAVAERRAGRALAAADRTGPADGRGLVAAARLSHRVHRQMAPGHGLAAEARHGGVSRRHRKGLRGLERGFHPADRQRAQPASASITTSASARRSTWCPTRSSRTTA